LSIQLAYILSPSSSHSLLVLPVKQVHASHVVHSPAPTPQSPAPENSQNYIWEIHTDSVFSCLELNSDFLYLLEQNSSMYKGLLTLC
jgi:hypothetical protein